MSSSHVYQTKSDGYFRNQRAEMLPFVPHWARRILDIGCGEAFFGEALKRERADVEVSGVEIVPGKAARAREKLDRVWEGAFGPALPLPERYFDCVVFNDVLEHMFDPGEALRYARSLLTPTGTVVASIPNIRHFPIVWKLAIKGRWDYAELGILDKTHLRFFTRSSILLLFQEAGYRVTQINGINRYMVNAQDEHSSWRYLKILQLVFPKRFVDMGYLQFAVAGVARSDAG